jgi:hypothetical protein
LFSKSPMMLQVCSSIVFLSWHSFCEVICISSPCRHWSPWSQRDSEKSNWRIIQFRSDFSVSTFRHSALLWFHASWCCSSFLSSSQYDISFDGTSLLRILENSYEEASPVEGPRPQIFFIFFHCDSYSNEHIKIPETMVINQQTIEELPIIAEEPVGRMRTPWLVWS